MLYTSQMIVCCGLGTCFSKHFLLWALNVCSVWIVFSRLWLLLYWFT